MMEADDPVEFNTLPIKARIEACDVRVGDEEVVVAYKRGDARIYFRNKYGIDYYELWQPLVDMTSMDMWVRFPPGKEYAVPRRNIIELWKAVRMS